MRDIDSIEKLFSVHVFLPVRRFLLHMNGRGGLGLCKGAVFRLGMEKMSSREWGSGTESVISSSFVKS